MPVEKVIWDAELQPGLDLHGHIETHAGLLEQLALGIDEEKTEQTVQIDTSEVVLWDEEMQDRLDHHGLLKHLAFGKDKFACGNEEMESAKQTVFDEMASSDVVWDSELLNCPELHDNLLEYLAWSGEYLADEECKPMSAMGTNFDLAVELGINSEDEMFSEMSPEIMMQNEEVPSDMDAHTSLLHQLDQGRELVRDELLPSQETHADFFPVEDGVALCVETPANISSHTLQQLAWREDFGERGMANQGKMLDAKTCKIVVGNEEMPSGLNAHEDLLQELAGGMESINNEKATLMNEVLDEKRQKDTSWAEELPCNLDAYDGLLQHLALGSDYLIQEQSKLNTVQLDPNLWCGLFQQLVSREEFLDDKMTDHIIELDSNGALLQVGQSSFVLELNALSAESMFTHLLSEDIDKNISVGVEQVYHQSTREAGVACRVPNKIQSWRGCFCMLSKGTRHVLQEELARSEQQLKQHRLTRRQWDPGIRWIGFEYKCYTRSYSWTGCYDVIWKEL
ncbi:unnamed protein product [Urochloa humidicola]